MILSHAQIVIAAEKWSEGKDTLKIALALHVPESVIYNNFDRIKAVSAVLFPKPPNPFHNTIGGASQISPVATVVPLLRQERQIDRAAVVAHQDSPRSVPSNLWDGALSCRTELQGKTTGTSGAKL